LAAVEQDGAEAATLRLGDAIANAEATLKAGRQAFPNEAMLLSEEGQLSNILSQAARAETAFDKAFAANQRSTLIAKRLARIKRSKGSFEQALAVLRKCLEFNPSSQDLHYDLAMTLLASRPDADQVEAATLLYHLRRSFAPGDRNLQAQFWYARQLCIADRFDEARPIFRALSDSRVPFKEKIEVRGELCGSDGALLELIGTVDLWRESWGFVVVTAPMKMRVFFKVSEADAELADYISVGSTVRLNLGFSLKGPVACNLTI